jgi:hypothetical protein
LAANNILKRSVNLLEVVEGHGGGHEDDDEGNEKAGPEPVDGVRRVLARFPGRSTAGVDSMMNQFNKILKNLISGKYCTRIRTYVFLNFGLKIRPEHICKMIR